MARRVSQKKRGRYSHNFVNGQDVLCNEKPCQGVGPRRLIYRRIKGMEQYANEEGMWPQKIDIYCWYCRLPFDTTPIPIVQQYDSQRQKFDVYGVCCSPECSKSYICGLKTNDGITRLMWQRKMVVEVFGWPIDKAIPMAHPWQALRVFGGHMEVDEWRKHTTGITMKLKMPPFVPFHIYLETEQKGVALIDQTSEKPAKSDPETLENLAKQHGAKFSFEKLKRPPEEKVIKTLRQLKETHPNMDVDMTSGSVFQEFLDTQDIPSEEQCEKEKALRETIRKAQRKRKDPNSKRTRGRKVESENIDVPMEPPPPQESKRPKRTRK